jgi:N-acetylglucosaminyl-diphospho-decaprenol L-rhamnosyltransferase
MADCSIIIVNWNTKEYLARCLNSLFSEYSINEYEIFVVDNNSTDGSVEFIQNHYNGITLIRNYENKGFVKANNQALKYASNKYVLFLNPDTEVQAGAIKCLTNYMERFPDVGAIGPLLVNSDGTFQCSYFSFPGYLSTIIEYIIPSKVSRGLEIPRLRNAKPRIVDVVRGACLMVKRDIVLKTGGFNRKIFMYSEETDLCYKIWKMGYKVIFYPGARVIHHERKSMNQLALQTTSYHYLRSKLIFIYDNYPIYKASKLLFIIMMSLKLRLLYFQLLDQNERADLYRNIIKSLNDDLAWKK